MLSRARRRDQVYAVEAANTHVAALARHDASFGDAMRAFDLICPDGMPLVWAINRHLRKSGKPVLEDRVYGPNLMLEVLDASAGHADLKHFLLGGSEEVLSKLCQRFRDEFTDVKIVGSYSPPFTDWPADEFDRIRDRIEESGANIVWVSLGCPKQERWIAAHKDELPAGCYFGIGAAFAFHAGQVSQAPAWLQKLGLEWLYRLSREPRRLWKRYLKYNGLYVWYYLNHAS